MGEKSFCKFCEHFRCGENKEDDPGDCTAWGWRVCGVYSTEHCPHFERVYSRAAHVIACCGLDPQCFQPDEFDRKTGCFFKKYEGKRFTFTPDGEVISPAGNRYNLVVLRMLIVKLREKYLNYPFSNKRVMHARAGM